MEGPAEHRRHARALDAVKIPRTMFRRVEELEARRSRQAGADDNLLRVMTDAELDEAQAILVAHSTPCPTCGVDPKQEPRRYCHHPSERIPWSRFKPDVQERLRSIYREAETRLDAARQGA